MMSSSSRPQDTTRCVREHHDRPSLLEIASSSCLSPEIQKSVICSLLNFLRAYSSLFITAHYRMPRIYCCSLLTNQSRRSTSMTQAETVYRCVKLGVYSWALLSSRPWRNKKQRVETKLTENQLFQLTAYCLDCGDVGPHFSHPPCLRLARR